MRLTVLSLLVAGAVLVIGTSPGDERLKGIEGYRKWTRATSAPRDLSPYMAALCRSPMPWELAPNPHIPSVYRVYVNGRGKAAMIKKSDKTEAFPVGSIIVKEKFSGVSGKDMTDRDLDKRKPDLLTVMVKQKDGWEYFAVSGDMKQVAADRGQCVKCHSHAADRDFVFRPYVGGP
jgi:hypothetical protein